MLYIRYDKPINQHQSKYSAFISFQWNPMYVEEIKKLPIRFWIPERKEWEIPTTLLYRVKEFEPCITELNQLQEEKKEIGELKFIVISHFLCPKKVLNF